jgi:AcrR family transcriptional regulator
MNSKLEQRNTGFRSTHQRMIETAVRLISEKGPEALSVASLAREMGIDRTTVYYHFKTREALVAAATAWASEQLSKAFEPTASRAERIDYSSRFVLENPELIKLWIDDLISPGDIRDSYPHWEELVRGVESSLAAVHGGEADAEVFCVILLTSAIIGPRVFRNRVQRRASTAQVMERFRKEWQRLLRAEGF